MKQSRVRKSIGIILCVLALLINYSPQVQTIAALPQDIVMREGQIHNLNLGLAMSVEIEGAVSVASSTDQTLSEAKRAASVSSVSIEAHEQGIATLSLRWLGIPLKSLNVKVEPERILMPGGQSIGIALTTNGVLVVGTSEVSGASSGSPAYIAGMRPGDLIQSIDKVQIESATQLTEIINKSSGKAVEVEFLRKNQLQKASVTPMLDKLDGQYRLGVWVRDSTAGVGTLSFYDPQTKRYAALGHAITDVDTGTNLTVRDGKVLFSQVMDIIKGQKGQPGELRGSFLREQNVFGNILRNTDYGVTGDSDKSIENPLYPKGLPVGSQATVHTGPAKILTTLDDKGIHEYAIEITRVNRQTEPAQKSMVIKVTDPALLEKTGGIVQGMSGSPIIQDGHIIGAVTHVFVNDPTQGYGLYVDWMIDQTDA